MRQIRILSGFLRLQLFRSLRGAIPPLLTATFFWITFYLFPFEPDYLITVGGSEMMVVCMVTTILLSDNANQATTYPFLLRLSRRSDLLLAIIISAVSITSMLSLFFVAAALFEHGVGLTIVELLNLIIRWPILFTFSAVVGLHLTQLTSLYYSHLMAYICLGAIVTVSDQERRLLRRGLDWLVDSTSYLTSPISMSLSNSGSTPLTSMATPLLGTIAYTIVLGLLAVLFFRRKDLLWMD